MEEVKCVMLDRSYATIYDVIIKEWQVNGPLNRWVV